MERTEENQRKGKGRREEKERQESGETEETREEQGKGTRARNTKASTQQSHVIRVFQSIHENAQFLKGGDLRIGAPYLLDVRKGDARVRVGQGTDGRRRRIASHQHCERFLGVTEPTALGK